MNDNQRTIIEFWNDEQNVPSKGQLLNRYVNNPGTSCMCAQGQILHIIGGYSVVSLADMLQDTADQKVAQLLDISVSHSRLLRIVNDEKEGPPRDVLTNPQKYLGPRYKTVLQFWHYYDSLSEEQKIHSFNRYRPTFSTFDETVKRSNSIIGSEYTSFIAIASPSPEIVSLELVCGDNFYFLPIVFPEFNEQP
jgi:hypothetical protein